MRILASRMSVLALGLLLNGCQCTRSLDVTVGVNPGTGATLATKVDFMEPAQCAIQKEIARASSAFARELEKCNSSTNALKCREDLNLTYKPLIQELLRINSELGARGMPSSTVNRNKAEARKRVDAFLRSLQ